MKTCKICYKPLSEIDQYGPIDFIVCKDCFHLDSEHNLHNYTLDELRNGDRIIKGARNDGYTYLPRPYDYELPLFTFGVTHQLAKPITQYVSRKQTQGQRAKRKKVYE